MSLSKLESLPNEVLIDTIEKYVNGVDILVALAHQLNTRVDSLIAQCQQLRFDFIRCRKDDFRLCIGLLPAYLDKISELALSERDTPGQIHAFLSFFPSFAPFKRLRTLSFHYNAEANDRDEVRRALLTLSKTNIETLSLKATTTEESPLDQSVIVSILSLKKLKRLSIAVEFDNARPDWSLLLSTSLNLEHLTITGLRCKWNDLLRICQSASRLKYLNVRLSPDPDYLYNQLRLKAQANVNVTPMPSLCTLILHFDNADTTTFDKLAQLLKVTPILHRLEISAHRELMNANAWEMLIQTSLPLLTHFKLTTTTFDLVKIDLQHVLESFQTPFWIAKKYFNIIIVLNGRSHPNSLPIDHVRGRGKRQLNINDSSILHPPVIGWWIAPERNSHDDFHTINSITSLRLSGQSLLHSRRYYFGHVKFLVLDRLNKDLVKLVITNINCLRITELAILLSDKRTDDITLLLTRTANISSLQISFNQLMAHQAAFIGRNNRLKCLDISEKHHTFDEKEIIVIAQLFPYIEHLVIYTLNLENVPMLTVYLPYLRSLTFRIIDNKFYPFDQNDQKLWEDSLRLKTRFLFQREANWITIWIDRAALEERFWKTFATTSKPVAQASGTTEVPKKKKFKL